MESKRRLTVNITDEVHAYIMEEMQKNLSAGKMPGTQYQIILDAVNHRIEESKMLRVLEAKMPFITDGKRAIQLLDSLLTKVPVASFQKIAEERHPEWFPKPDAVPDSEAVE